jgi:meso-butanediol dehydrogenase / (S,S)-butanediol dehydrogenase / diacetyl reductase
MRLKDKVAIVTGAGGGLGEAICFCLAREGAKIVVSDLKPDLAEKVAAKLRAQGKTALAVQTDVRMKKDCQTLIDKTLKEMSKVDILVNNAGVSGLFYQQESTKIPILESISEDDLNLTIDVNLKGVFFCTQAVVPYFKEQKSGKIVNISSIGGRKGFPFLPHYGATKAGVIVFTQAIASQLAPYNVNVNTVCPGLIWTPMWDELAQVLGHSNPALKGLTPDQIFKEFIQSMIPLGRPQMPEDIGNAVVFFVSDEAKEITGQALNVDGGAVFN